MLHACVVGYNSLSGPPLGSLLRLASVLCATASLAREALLTQRFMSPILMISS